MKRTERRKRQRGQAIVEASLMMPWLVFLFVGVLDFGFYAYTAICVQNAARAVAIASANPMSTVKPCDAALGELNTLPHGSVSLAASTCTQYPSGVGANYPYSACVTTLYVTLAPSDINCSTSATQKCADCTLASATTSLPTSVQAMVSFQTVPMIPIPGILTGQLTMTRTAEVRALLP